MAHVDSYFPKGLVQPPISDPRSELKICFFNWISPKKIMGSQITGGWEIQKTPLLIHILGRVQWFLGRGLFNICCKSLIYLYIGAESCDVVCSGGCVCRGFELQMLCMDWDVPATSNVQIPKNQQRHLFDSRNMKIKEVPSRKNWGGNWKSSFLLIWVSSSNG